MGEVSGEPETLLVRRLRPTGRVALPLPARDLWTTVVGAPSALAAAVRDVEASEEALTPDGVRQALASGRLRSTDLVYLDGAWHPLLETQPFGDAAGVRARIEARRRTLWSGALFLVTLAILVFGGWFIWNVYGPWRVSLNHPRRP